MTIRIFKSLLLLASLFTHHVFSLKASVSIENPIVNSNTAMILNITPEVDIPPQGSISIITASSFVPIAGLLDCQISEPTSIKIDQCQIQGSSGKLARIWLSQGVSSGITLVIKIRQFRNYGATLPIQSLQVSTQDEFNKEIETLWDVKLSELSPAKIQEVQIKPESGEVGADTSLIISFKVGISLPCPSCEFILKLPLQGQFQGDGFFTMKNLKCFIDYSEVPQECNIAEDTTFGKHISLRSISTRRIQAGTYLKFRLEGFKSPIDRKAVSGFQIFLKVSEGGLTEISDDLSIQAQIPAQISNASVSIHEGSTTISETSTLQVSFDLPNPLSQGCIIEVQIPEDFSQLYRKVTKIQTSGMFGFPQSVPFEVKSGGLVEIREACPTYIENREQAIIKIQTVQNPSSVRDTGLFQIIVFDNDRNQIATLAHATRVLVSKDQLTPSLFNKISIIPTNGTVQESSGLSIELAPSSFLSASAQIKLQFPFDFTLASSCSIKAITLSVLSEYAECRVNKTHNTVYLSNLFYAFGYDPEADPEISFIINNVIQKNPVSTFEDQSLEIQVSTFELSEQTGSNDNVDNGFYDISGSINPGELQIFSFLFNETVAFTFPTSMKISMLLAHDIPREVETSLKIQFPEDFQIDQENSYVLNRQGFTTKRPNVRYLTDKSLLIDGLQENQAGNSVEFILTRLRLPRFQGKVPDDITVQTVLTSTGGIIDQNRVTVFVENAQSFSFVSLENFSDKNQEMTSVEFKVQIQNLPLQESDKIQIDFPLQMSIDKHPTCFIESHKRECEANFQRRRVIIGLQNFEFLNRSDSIDLSIKVEGARNPSTTKKINGPQISIVNNKQQILMANNLYPQYIQTKTPADMDVVLRQSNTDPLTISSYTLEFANLEQLAEIGLEIRFPDCMRFSPETLQLLKITDQFGIELQFQIEHGSTIVVPQIYAGLRLLILEGIINPSENCLKLGGIQLISFSQSNRLELKDSTELIPSLSCDPQCLACHPTIKDYCTLCPPGFLLTTENKCAKKCSEGTFFNIQANECQECSTECETCEQSANLCTKCKQSDKFLLQNKCVPAEICLENESFFVDKTSQTCQTCSVKCAKCSQNAFECSQCWEDQVLHAGKCLEKCPINFESQQEGDFKVCKDIDLLQHIQLILMDSFGVSAIILLSTLILFAKCCCMRQMGIMVSLVILTSSIEALMTYFVLVYSFYEKFGEKSHEALSLKYSLVAVCGIIVIFNCVVTAKHWLSISKKTKLELEEEKQTDYQEVKLTKCATLCYLLSALISFHNTAWLNINGQLDLMRKRRLFENDFIRFYSRSSKMWVIIPGLPIKAIGIYFGVLGGGQIFGDDHFRLRTLLLDLALVSTLSSFCINMALNFQLVDDDTEIDENFQTEGGPEENQRKLTLQDSDLILNGKNSIALINLKLSQNDLSHIQKSRSRILQLSQNKPPKLLQNPSKKLDSLAAINLFRVEQSILKAKNSQKPNVSYLNQSNNSSQFVLTRNDMRKEPRQHRIQENFEKDEKSSDQSFEHFGAVIKKNTQLFQQNQRRSSISSNPTTEMTLKSHLPKKQKEKMLSLWQGAKSNREMSKSTILQEINHQKFLAQFERKVKDFELENEQQNRTTDEDASKFESNERLEKPKIEEQFKGNKMPSLSDINGTNQDIFAQARKSLSKYLE